MKRTILSLLVCFLVVWQAQAQLLWKVSGGGLQKPSYVIGTYHLANAAFADSIAGLNAALTVCDQVYGELDMASLTTDMQAALTLQQAMMLPQGTTLDSLLTPEQMTRLNATLREYLGADFSNPALAPVKQMKPAALAAQLQVAMCMKVEKGFDPQRQFDAYFQQVAQKQGKAVGGLETVQQQADILFNNKPLARQTEELLCLVDNADYQMDVVHRTVTAFYAQDLAAVEQVMEEKMNNACDATPEEENALIYDRNAAWAKQLPALMQQKPTFVAVGAAHLPGERGLLSLLRRAGYEVTPVK